MSDVTAKIVTPQPPPDTRRVVLEMPYDVAVTLRDLTGSILGGGNTYRVHADLLFCELDRAMADEDAQYGARFIGAIKASEIDTSTE